MSKLAEPEGELGDCCRVLAWAIEASKGAKHGITKGAYQRDVKNVIRVYACLSD